MDRAFDVLNSKSKFGRGFKAPITPRNRSEIEDIYNEFSSYLLNLEDGNHSMLHTSRRKTFVVGFICTFNALLLLSDDLFADDFTYLSTFRASQDFVETLFSKIRRMGGHNNNPTAVGFRAALRKLLMKQSVCSSPVANSADCDSNSGLFSLQWCKRKAPMPDAENEDPDLNVVGLLQTCSDHKLNVLGYIAGYIVRGLKGSVKCHNCITHLAEQCSVGFCDHTYVAGSSNELMKVKNRGGLVTATDPVVQVVTRCEQVFTQYVSQDFIAKGNPAGILKQVTSLRP